MVEIPALLAVPFWWFRVVRFLPAREADKIAGQSQRQLWPKADVPVQSEQARALLESRESSKCKNIASQFAGDNGGPILQGVASS